MLEELPSESKREQLRNPITIEVEEISEEPLKKSINLINPDQYELRGPSESLN